MRLHPFLHNSFHIAWCRLEFTLQSIQNGFYHTMSNTHCQYPHQFTEKVSIIFLPEKLKSRTKVFLSISCIAHHSVHLVCHGSQWRSCLSPSGSILCQTKILGHECCSKPSTIVIAGGYIVQDTRAGVVGVNTPASSCS